MDQSRFVMTVVAFSFFGAASRRISYCACRKVAGLRHEDVGACLKFRPNNAKPEQVCDAERPEVSVVEQKRVSRAELIGADQADFIEKFPEVDCWLLGQLVRFRL